VFGNSWEPSVRENICETREDTVSVTRCSTKAKAPARGLVSIDDVGVATAFLALDAARLITGETLYVDGGYHIID
jgi:enoyl-[acyl-carrier-protein] reductase (NADH)